jgi:hypothetical protein
LRRLPRGLNRSRGATTGLELSQISFHIRHLPQMGQGFLQDRGGDRIARSKKPIVHPPPLSPCGHDSRVAEIRQMPRDFRLADFEDLHEIADANFLVGDEIEEAKARAIGQSAKEKIDRERLFFPGHGSHYIWLDRYEQWSVWFIHTHKRIYSSP